MRRDPRLRRRRIRFFITDEGEQFVDLDRLVGLIGFNVGRQRCRRGGDPVDNALMIDVQVASNGPKAHAFQMQLQRLGPDRSGDAPFRWGRGEVAPAVLAAIALGATRIPTSFDRGRR